MSKATSVFALMVGLLVVGIPRPASAADELAPDVATAFDLSTFATGLVLPTAIEFLPDGRLVITEKLGQVLVHLPNGTMVEAGKFDVDSHTEKGLLNVIRHPDFVHNHQLIFFYSSASAPETDKQKISIVRLGDDNHLDFSTERVLVKDLRGPDDHEMGGGLAIDKEGNLLIGVGDTGCRAHKHPEPPYAPTNYFATCLTNGNGKILRVGLDGSIPADNPLVNVPLATTCGERCGDDPFSIAPSTPRKDIWVWGLRNPWRIWVDPKTGYAWTADVGDITNEEIDVIPPEGGRDYGWPWREGSAGHALTRSARRRSRIAGTARNPHTSAGTTTLRGTPTRAASRSTAGSSSMIAAGPMGTAGGIFLPTMRMVGSGRSRRRRIAGPSSRGAARTSGTRTASSSTWTRVRTGRCISP